MESTKTTKRIAGATQISSTYGDDRYWICATVQVTGSDAAALLSEIFPADPSRDTCHSFNKDELRDLVLDLKVSEYDELAEKWFDRHI
jgi:hypothetical protein